MRRAMVAGLAMALVAPIAAAAQDQEELAAPWDESETVTVTSTRFDDVIGVDVFDYCRVADWLTGGTGDPGPEVLQSCADTLRGMERAWLPSDWLPRFDATTPTPEAAPAPEPTKESSADDYTSLSKRDWQRLVKSPDKYSGKRYRVWACITQFDAATGDEAFRGNASYKRQKEWFLDTDNAIFTGDAERLDPFVADDIVSMRVIGGGSLSYETTIGGETTVPVFEVVTIKREKGSCEL